MTRNLCACGSVKSASSKACNPCEFARRSAERVLRKTRTCVGCGFTFVKSATGGNKGLYCSRECRFATMQRQAADRVASIPPPPSKACLECGAPFVKRGTSQVCSYQCRVLLDARKPRQYQPRPERSSRCRWCGVVMVYRLGARKSTCASEICRAKTKKLAARISRLRSGKRRGMSHFKRARLQGAKSERINRIKVFKKAGWKCQICDIPTPRHLLKDCRHQCSPTLDHVVPLSRGGSHTYDNVQCLCRKCNSNKGNGPQPHDLQSHLRVLVGASRVSSVMSDIHSFMTDDSVS